MNDIFIILIRCILVALYMLTLNKFMKAKKMDSEMKFKFNFRSLVEIVLVTGINMGIIFMPVTDGTRTLVLVGGQVMIVLTYLHLRRFVVFGKKVVFLLEHAFLISDLKHYKYEKGKMSFIIKNVPLKIRFPLSDTDYIQERLSGKYFRK